MCFAEKCCYIIPLDLGCILLGICNFVLSAVMFATSAVFLNLHENTSISNRLTVTSFNITANVTSEHDTHQNIFGYDTSSLNIIIYLTLVLSFVSMMASVLLVIGIKKGKANLVLCYFVTGIVLTIVCQLGGLLGLLAGHWITALLAFIASFVYIHFLVVVNTVYDELQRGKEFGFSPHQPLQDAEYSINDE